MLETVTLAGVGVVITGTGIVVSRGRTELLAQYPDRQGSRKLAHRAGGVLTSYGLLTLGVASLSAQTEVSTALWIAWILITVLVGFGVAALALVTD